MRISHEDYIQKFPNREIDEESLFASSDKVSLILNQIKKESDNSGHYSLYKTLDREAKARRNWRKLVTMIFMIRALSPNSNLREEMLALKGQDDEDQV